MDKIIAEIEKLTIVELNNLVKQLEEKFGVSAAAVAVAGPAAGAGAAAAAEDEKSDFDLVLKEAGANKIAVIKVVKELTGLGLAESKKLVDEAPQTIKEKMSKKDADEAAAKLKEAGATCELK